MEVIAVDKAGLNQEFTAWLVDGEYAEFFISKCVERGGRLELPVVAFNDTILLNSPRDWLGACFAFWCQVYREAENASDQQTALGAIRSLYFLAGFFGDTSMIIKARTWWGATYPLHLSSDLNTKSDQPYHYQSAILNAISKH